MMMMMMMIKAMNLLWERQPKKMDNKEMPKNNHGFQAKSKQQSEKA